MTLTSCLINLLHYRGVWFLNIKEGERGPGGALMVQASQYLNLQNILVVARVVVLILPKSIYIIASLYSPIKKNATCIMGHAYLG